ncbi:MAG: PAS domain S-box protein [Deltaproteobacteria bacterium]|nr:MAG: PAS domain S-box protein [Deltaproteobacteria bacterium]
MTGAPGYSDRPIVPRWERKDLPWVAAVGAAYFIAVRLSYLFPDSSNVMAAIWPASGISLAALLLRPKRKWPVLLAVIGAVDFLGKVSLGKSIPVSAGYMLANVMEPMLGGWFISRGFASPVRFTRTAELAALFVAAVLVNGFTSLVGAGTASLAFGAPFLPAYQNWWVADGMGMLLITPLIVIGAGAGPELRRAVMWPRIAELAAFAVLFCTLLWLLFGPSNLTETSGLRPYAIVLLFIWVALRFGRCVTASALLMFAVVAVNFAGKSLGSAILGGEDPARHLLFVQLFIAVITMTALLLVVNVSERKGAERNALEARDLLQAMMDGTTDAIYIKDLQGRYRLFNAAASRITGKSSCEVIGRDDTFLFPPEEARAVMDGDRGVTDSGKTMTYEEQVTTADGKKSTFLSTKGPVIDEQGNVTGLFGVARDITERKRAAAEVTRAAQEWQRTFDATNDAIWILDGDQCVVRSNRTAERFFPSAGGRFVGRRCYEIVHGTSEPPHDCPLLRSRKSLHRESMDLFLGGGWFEVVVDPILDAEGRFDGAVHILSDITGRKKAEAERNRLAAAIEQAGETVVITDPGGSIEYVNPAFERTTGYSREEAVGRNPRILKSGKQDEAFYGRMWRAISEGRTWEGRMVNKRKDGTCYTEDATISPVFDATGKIVNYVAVKRDITEHLRLAEQFEQSQKMESVGRLAGGVAHDFNNLLTVITGYSELLLQKMEKGSPHHRDVEEILRAGDRAAALTQQLLAFSRKQIIEPKVVRLDLLVADMQGMLTRLIGEDVALQATAGKSLGTVKVDPGQFQQILMNLAVNARDAMPGGGKIAIETTNVDLDEEYCARHPYVTPGRYVMLAVSDTGVGMSEEVKAHLFEPFFTTKERGCGTGLGLATTYGVVRQSGGSIEVHSEVGTGTIFRIYLPRVEEEIVAPSKINRPEYLPRGTETVLIVEDDDTVRKLCVRILGDLGYQVMQARTGAEAVAAAVKRGDRIDLLLTDVVMPGMSGSELATQLVLHHPEMKVLFTSGYTEDAISHRGVLDEGVMFIGKPYTPAALARKVREVLDGK